ncbi:FecR family protein [Chitinophaga caseinilytica]|uniref:FecR family protein n=1 Tax=Chitinophaga caseinilytica TaxID=2267521 RepID=UPI003C30C057
MSNEQRDKVRLLLRQYYAGSIGESEAAELGRLLQEGRYDALMHETLAGLGEAEQPMDLAPEDMDRTMARIHARKVPAKVRSLHWRKIAVAAAIVLMAGAGGYYALRPAGKTAATARHFGGEAMPGSNKATLTLGDGSLLNLSDAENGELAAKGGGNAVKTGQGALAYAEGAGDMEYHTLTTPRGGQYRLTLPDGSVVWLNAGSALRYPTAFEGKERAVELTGEAYFEVSAQTERPFTVKLRDGANVLVLGTGFNVQAYADEPASRTTLVNGAVLVKKGTEQQLLRPGQEAIAAAGIQLNAQADVEAATAWKNGIFLFRDAPIDIVMKQLSRWYDVDVKYEKGTVKEFFNGTIPRNVPLSKVLELLELTGLVHFTINGNTVTVTP